MSAALLVSASPLLATTATAEPVPDYPALGAVFPLGDHSAPKAGYKELAPGVTYRVFTQGVAAGDVWTVWVRFDDGQEMTSAQSTATAHAEKLRTAGYADARVVPLNSPATADTYAQTFYGVHVGSYTTATEAQALQADLKGKGFADTRVLYTAETDPESRGPWQIRVITVRPDAQVDLRAEHGATVSGSETVRQLSATAGALAAVNGTEFDINSINNTHFMGHEGVPQGLYMKNNVLLGAANNGRTALLLNAAGGHRITEVKSRTWITAPDGSSREVDGINRVAGQILGCGGVGDDFRKTATTGNVPRLDPWRNGTCYDPNEIVVFRPEWGARTPAPAKEWTGAPVTEVVMNGNWDVLELRDAPGPIPPGGRVLQGIGKGREWLRTLKSGDRVVSHTSVTDMAGTPVTSSALSAFGGGTPALMRDGQVWLNPAANGMAHVACVLPAPATGCRPSGALTSRHPRTLAGISPQGHLMLVTIDGRNPAGSVGVTLPEAARVMEWLGARDAVGLGSGGDTTLMVDNTLYNRPWDQWTDTTPTERAMSNAVVVVKRP
ncbi:phosphodiester glycosidase family protein [Streptomyces sp. NPDC096319]|uniref:phosphodiester glycosidase family protein n=1 Tax=Streptomyces sp. NPDC096319 TaxID=3366084 RepID=UPI0038291121